MRKTMREKEHEARRMWRASRGAGVTKTSSRIFLIPRATGLITWVKMKWLE
jgi:hypothetical protein